MKLRLQKRETQFREDGLGLGMQFMPSDTKSASKIRIGVNMNRTVIRQFVKDVPVLGAEVGGPLI